MKAEGIDVCGFGAGEPDFDTPEHIKQAAIEALQAGFTKYTPSAGIPELRAAIAEKLAADNGLTYRANQVVGSNGAKHSCYKAILATCQPGDEVSIPAPYWVRYPDMVRLDGGWVIWRRRKQSQKRSIQFKATAPRIPARSDNVARSRPSKAISNRSPTCAKSSTCAAIT